MRDRSSSSMLILIRIIYQLCKFRKPDPASARPEVVNCASAARGHDIDNDDDDDNDEKDKQGKRDESGKGDIWCGGGGGDNKHRSIQDGQAPEALVQRFSAVTVTPKLPPQRSGIMLASLCLPLFAAGKEPPLLANQLRTGQNLKYFIDQTG
ncbi:hypothetical protein EJ05DRAFT_498569 [Pseudovirgaria hyperparasitica]|uniref:Uncharacterized protein n=1 Tax=Pseudovirgaria hyperparasitica TaxID=470096 RepID=A0A6A6WDG6_9PEZI|nr:uncharacterized protein EJ05DRAFT_498569 [Pseudovirgaria hyperparasitica]KAF2760615.1 hypothetical protein EJ05DRAFT_498569 [Pseudovirgaria hyperparasitica]